MKNSIQNQPFTGAYSIKVDLTPFHAGDRVYLPDTPVLQDKYITAIGVYWNASAVQDPDGDNIGVNDLSDMYLTLVGLDNVNFFPDIPMGYFRQKNRQLDINRYIFLPNCYITLGNPTDKNFLLMTFFYTDKIDCNVLPDAKETNIQPLEVPVFDSPYNQFYLPDNRILVNRKIRNIYSSYIETKAGGGGDLLFRRDHRHRQRGPGDRRGGRGDHLPDQVRFLHHQRPGLHPAVHRQHRDLHAQRCHELPYLPDVHDRRAVYVRVQPHL